MQTHKNLINLSTILSKMRQYNTLSTKATFWFGGILSLIQDSTKNDINDDLTIDGKIQIIKIVSRALSSISNFYQQERPNSVYKLLNFTENLLDQLENNRQFSFVLSKVSYLNTLSIYAIKTRQYAYAFNIFSEILQIFHSKIVDNTNQPFIAFLNNYLAFLRRSNKKMTSKMIEIQSLLKDSFIKFFTKIMVVDKAVNLDTQLSSINLLAAIFKQNETLFTKYQKDVNSLILHSYQSHLKAKRKIPEDMITYIFKQKIKKLLYFGITFSQDEIKFYSAHKNKVAQSLVMRRHQEEEQPEKKLTKIQAMLEQSIQMLNQQKLTNVRYATLQKNQASRLSQMIDINSMKPMSTLNKSVMESQTKNFQTLQPLPKTFTRKRDVQPIRPIKPITKIVRFKAIIFKIRSIFIQINEDGILLSDYTKQNKRYIQWNTLSMIIERIQLHFPFQEILKIPVQNYYDFIRIISFYLTKNDNKDICLISKPLPLLEVNQLIKLYKQQGKYLKLALMNHYDSQKFVGVIDCYMSQFSQFFKNLNENEYLMLLNQKISKGNTTFDRQENTYLLDYLKRKRETTVAQLGNQLQSQHLEYAIQEKNTIYKSVFLLKNNLQLYVRIQDNIKLGTSFENYTIEVKIDNISNLGNQTFYLSSEKDINTNEKKISKIIEIPIQRLTYYLPPYNLSIKDYLTLYSRPILDMLNFFDEYSDEVNLGGLSFQVKVHASRTDMIEYGRYYSVVSAEVIGSKQRVWAMVIRFYDLAYVSQKVTVLMNPYYEFLQNLITATPQEKILIMKHLLVNENVKETYNWLKRNNKLERRMNMFQYLYANQLI